MASRAGPLNFERRRVPLPRRVFDVLWRADETSPCSIYDGTTNRDFRGVLGAADLVPGPIWHCDMLHRRIPLLRRTILALSDASPRGRSSNQPIRPQHVACNAARNLFSLLLPRKLTQTLLQ